MPLVAIDIQAIPTVHTEDAAVLISDSGITRYRLNAKIWDMYSGEGDPYWYFPEKIHIERLDSHFQPEGSIDADTAYYFERKELWRAVGNVVVKNLEGRTFETSELFWDRKIPPNVVNAFYTYQSVKVVEPDGNITYGRSGFKADQALNIIRFFSTKGEFNIEESTDSLQQETTRSDSIQHP
ncbi:MAG: LPS export ABC transporter periplasmic protein LptC [Candidatus Azobacteroides sp.]|nr:LPS export ABC transporter periplasmic protein LptC [Candidatus Azobacteroides sp.]